MQNLIYVQSINHRLKIIKYEYIKTFDFSNNDGVSAPGLRALIAVMAEIGDVLVVRQASKRHGSCHNNKQHLINKKFLK
jgi:hypothetical protein